MAQDSSRSQRLLTHRAPAATTSTTTTTTSPTTAITTTTSPTTAITTTTTTTTTSPAITTATTTVMGRHQKHSGINGMDGMDDIIDCELPSECSFVGFECDTMPARLFTDLRQIVMKGSTNPLRKIRKLYPTVMSSTKTNPLRKIRKSSSGRNGVIHKEQCGIPPLRVSENVATNSLQSLQKVIKDTMIKKENPMDLENPALHDNSHPEVGDACYIALSLTDNDDDDDDDDSTTDVIVIKDVMDSSLTISSTKQSGDHVQHSVQEIRKEDECVPPLHCPTYKEPYKEIHKEPYKEPHKELQKEPYKEFSKELHKELHEEPHKELHKEPAKKSDKELDKKPDKDSIEEPPLVVELQPENYFLDPQLQMEDESQYHLFGVPEFIEEVITVDDDVEIGPEMILDVNTFSSPISSVVLDHSYSSQCMQEPQMPSPGEESSEVSCWTGTVLQDGNDTDSCEAESYTSGINDAVLVCESDDDVRDSANSAAEVTTPHYSQASTTLHLPSSDGIDGLNNTTTTSNDVIPDDLPPQNSDGENSIATNTSVPSFIAKESHPQGIDTSDEMSITTTSTKAHPSCPIESELQSLDAREGSRNTPINKIIHSLNSPDSDPQSMDAREKSRITPTSKCIHRHSATPRESDCEGVDAREGSSNATTDTNFHHHLVPPAESESNPQSVETNEGSSNTTTDKSALPHSVTATELDPKGVNTSNEVANTTTKTDVLPHPHTTTNNRPRTRSADRALDLEHLGSVRVILRNILTSQPHGKFGRIEDFKLDVSGSSFCSLNAKIHKPVNMNVQNDESKNTEQLEDTDTDDRRERGGSEEKMNDDRRERGGSEEKMKDDRREREGSKEKMKDDRRERGGSEEKMKDDSRERGGSEEKMKDDRREGGSEEKMLIRSSIQLRKRKIYKLIPVPQRKSINYDRICDIDSYYTRDVTPDDSDLPVSREKEFEMPPDLFPSIKAEKKAVSKVWEVLVSQLEDCIRGITTLPPAVAVHSKKRKRSVSRGKKRGSGCMMQKQEIDGHVSASQPIENQHSRTSKYLEGERESDQTTQTCGESTAPVVKRKQVCFCRYNTVLPLASRRTCCGRRKVKSGCRRSSRTSANSEEIAYPTDQRSFFSSLGLMDKSLYDKDVHFESLVMHRTRKMRANQIKGKNHYRTLLSNRHGDSSDQNSERLKQPLPLTFISKESVCKLSSKEKAINKVSNVDWFVDKHVGDHNFEGFGGAASKESGSTRGSSQECSPLEATINLGKVATSVNNSDTLSAVSFCCTDTNDNFTENYSIPTSQTSHLDLGKTPDDREECPVCKDLPGKCSLDHRVEMEAAKSVSESKSCDIFQEKDQSSQTEDNESSCAEKDDDEGCFGGRPTLLDYWSMSEEEFSTLDSDAPIEEINEDSVPPPTLDEHSVSAEHDNEHSLSSVPEADEYNMSAEPVADERPMSTEPDEQPISKLDMVDMDYNSDSDSSGCSLPNLWTIGLEKRRSVTKGEIPGGSTTKEDQCVSEDDTCDFVGFDSRTNGSKYSPREKGKENTSTGSQDHSSRHRWGGESKLKYLQYQRQAMTQLLTHCTGIDDVKDLDVSCYGATPKAASKDRDIHYKGKLSRTSIMEHKHELKKGDVAADSIMRKDTFLPGNHASKVKSDARTPVFLSTRGTKTVRASTSPTPRSPRRNKMAIKLPEFDFTRNCRVNLTKIQIPERALSGVKINTEDSNGDSVLFSELSPEKSVKKDKSESESCITLSKFSERLSVERLKYSDLLKPSMRRSMTGLCKKARLPPDGHTGGVSDEVVYQCNTCWQTFTSHTTLNTHLETHRRMEHTCEECGQSFQEELELQSHARLHRSAQQAVLCERCGLSFSQLEDLRNHVKNHLSPKCSKCRLCSQSCKCEASLTEPCKCHAKDCGNKCVECSPAPVTATSGKPHTRTHSRGKTEHQCVLCKVKVSPHSKC